MSPETKIMVSLAALLLAIEGSVRLAEPALSKDLKHIRQLDSLVQPDAVSFDILLIGNSLARRGVDRDVLVEALGRDDDSDSSPKVAMMVPDATNISEWSYGFRRYVLEKEGRPGLVLLFTGPSHLADPKQLRTSRMAAFFVSERDRLGFMRDRLATFENRSEFLFAAGSRLFADRDRVRPLFFYNAVPGYEQASRAINAAAGGKPKVSPGQEAPASAAEASEFHFLDLLVESANATGARLVAVSVPIPERYEVSKEVRDRLASHGVPFLRLGETLEIPVDRFPDGYHLDEAGAGIFTRELVRQLRDIESR